MKGSRSLKRLAATGILALPSLVFGGDGAALAQALDIPQMTIQIYNNSTNFNVYPVILFPGASRARDTWLQALFGTTWGNQFKQTFITGNGPSAVRAFVNCCDAGQTGGIPPGGKAEIKLPLYTPLVAPDFTKFPNSNGIDPTKPDQVVEWWQGININFYRTSVKDSGPPDALQALWGQTNQQEAKFPAGGKPNCTNKGPCDLNFYVSKTNDPITAPTPNDPQQLVEGTLGSAVRNGDGTDPTAKRWTFVTTLVDYDVSYVNAAFLPVVLEPLGNDRFGWVGTPDSVANFSNKVQSFLKTAGLGQQWPQYIANYPPPKDTTPKTTIGKVPSVLEILLTDVANDPNAPKADGQWLPQACPDPPPTPNVPCPSHFTPYPPNSGPIKRLVNAWKNCQTKGDINTFCTYINDTTTLIRKNFDNYVANFKSNPPGWNCNQTKNPHPIDKAHLTDLQVLQHLYGWQPFNEFCSADANLLQQTPGYFKPGDDTHDPPIPPDYSAYQDVKNEFDHLQYWRNVLEGDYGVFHPYVAMIHGPTYINSPFTYAYSVDDAVGNVLTDGTGWIIAVGGLQNMPNQDHNSPDIHFNFPYKNLANGNTFVKYGRCKKVPDTPVNPNFSSISVPAGVVNKLVTDCPISLQDNKGRIYLLQIGDAYTPYLCIDPKTQKPSNDVKCTDATNWVFIEDTPDIGNNKTARLPIGTSCAMNSDKGIQDWCNFTYAFKQHENDAARTITYHVSIRGPID